MSILNALASSNCQTEPTWNSELDAYESVGPELGCRLLQNTPLSIDHSLSRCTLNLCS